MPSLNWIGKEAVVNHDKEVSFKLLKKVKTVSVGDNSQNLIIHGDNLEALKALMPFYYGKIKCIYIDPPYNTGNENWVYNDKVNSPKIKQWFNKTVKIDDLARHDKWLCMMYPRLKLLKDLLSEDGAIFVSIDDNEHCNLREILEEIFQEKNFIESFIWKSRLGKGATSQTTAKLHEYVIAYAKDIDKLQFKTDKRISSKEKKERLRQWGQGDKREDRPTMYYPIYSKEFGEVFPKKPDGTDGRWRISKNGMDQLIASGLVFFEKQKDGRIEAYKIIPVGSETNTAYSSILDSEVVKTTAHGSVELESIFGEKIFPYPKPSSLIKEIISLCTKSNDIILDSFAGSGTTGHAVLDLNKEDRGNRKFIMIEMEDKVAKDITAERVKMTIKKFSYKDGFEYCELDKPLFNEYGQIEETCDFKQFATYIYFTETQTNIDAKKIDGNFVGELEATEYYLIYKGKNKNDLNKSFLKKIKDTDNKKIIYADRCLIDDDTLAKYNIVFKQIPYEVKVY
ncbi:MAG: site-specific DNA-methyltransferase [Candidatus Moranbacteria bacterium]|nr:site-specific DNA-methyltransferase [Candidatus Moranbacteria bacterium]